MVASEVGGDRGAWAEADAADPREASSHIIRGETSHGAV
jgi:hypothetical protein